MSAVVRLLNAKYAALSLGRRRRPRIFVNSIPKAGTNLVVSLALVYGRIRVSGPVIGRTPGPAQFTGRSGLIFGHVEHLPETAEELGLDAMYLLVRRPDRYAISLARYIEVNRRHPAHGIFLAGGAEALFGAILSGIEIGRFRLEPIDQRYRSYIDTARTNGSRIADFDRLLRAGGAENSSESALLRTIGGPDYALRFNEMLTRSKRSSTTFRHSSRATLPTTLPDAITKHAVLKEAQRLYENVVPH
ncbi:MULTISPECIES: hypothetical protein [unclassified Marinovum]|uniref:hypothetical protein n=1 Tax=unclassified Marinovum TaxID=2647166 RepID=UPI003EDC1384